jgi:hypothetical protein
LPESNPTSHQPEEIAALPSAQELSEAVTKEKWDEAATGMIKQMANNILDTTEAEVVMLLVQWDHDTKQIVAVKRDLRLDRMLLASLSIVNGMSEVGLKALCAPEPEEEKADEKGTDSREKSPGRSD